jgi:hypothetical protein
MVSDPEFDGDAQARDESLVLGDVVGGSKMKPDYIAHVDSEGQDEEQTRACSCFHQQPVEVHGQSLAWS